MISRRQLMKSAVIAGIFGLLKPKNGRKYVDKTLVINENSEIRDCEFIRCKFVSYGKGAKLIDNCVFKDHKNGIPMNMEEISMISNCHFIGCGAILI